MLNISDAVATIVRSDFTAQDALQRSVLNYSAYAQQIQPRVEALTMKQVKLGSIVVSLSRLAPQLVSETLKPKLVLNDLGIRSPLVDISYDRNADVLESARNLRQKLNLEEHDFFTVTEGSGEVTIIAPDRFLSVIMDSFPSSPKMVFVDLVGVTVRFSSNYTTEPNTLFCILESLAARKINIIEIVSTFTSLSVIVERPQSEETVLVLQNFLR